MARTPLVSRLQRVFVRLSAARAAGLPLDAALEAESLRRAALVRAPRGGGSLRRGGLTRRELVKAAAAAGLLTACGQRRVDDWSRSGARGGNGPVIAVVGGGLAGLVAARRLAGHGLRSNVYEAAPRAGGRVDTDDSTFAAGQRVERGGELIDTGHERYRELIGALGLELDDLPQAEAPGTEDLGYFDGAPYTEAQVAADFAPLLPRVQADLEAAGYPTRHDLHTPAGLALDRLSITEWIESRVPGGLSSRFGRLLAIAYTIEYGAEAEQQSALNLLYLLGGSTASAFSLFGESDERFRVRGGNGQVPALLAAELDASIRLRHTLLAARTLGDGRVRLSFETPAGTRDVTADHVVMTVPFAVLRARVDLDRLQLAPLKRTAIAEQGMGTNSKLHVQFTGRPWVGLGCNGATDSDQGYQNTWEETRAQPGVPGILNNFTGGTLGASFGSGAPEQRARTFLSQIEAVLPGLGAAWNGRASIDFWAGSPFQLGSYSYWKVGQYTRFAGVEGAVEGRVHFAGEHTSTDFQGFMEGAVESGERAADELLAALGARRARRPVTTAGSRSAPG